MRHDRPPGKPQKQLDELLPDLYEQLRRLASRELRGERAGHTLQTTALAHEAYMRLARQRDVDWVNRGQILSAAAHFMRRILVDHARQRAALKRGGDRVRVALGDVSSDKAHRADVELIALDDALDRLAILNERQARMVELRYFGGLTVDETARELGSSPATVHRDWRLTKAWLFRELATGGAAAGG